MLWRWPLKTIQHSPSPAQAISSSAYAPRASLTWTRLSWLLTPVATLTRGTPSTSARQLSDHGSSRQPPEAFTLLRDSILRGSMLRTRYCEPDIANQMLRTRYYKSDATEAAQPDSINLQKPWSKKVRSISLLEPRGQSLRFLNKNPNMHYRQPTMNAESP